MVGGVGVEWGRGGDMRSVGCHSSLFFNVLLFNIPDAISPSTVANQYICATILGRRLFATSTISHVLALFSYCQ